MISQQNLNLSIAGIRVSLVCHDSSLADKLRRSYWAFACDNGADFIVTIDFTYRQIGPISPSLKIASGSELIKVIPGHASEASNPIDYSGSIDLIHNWAKLSFSASSPFEEIEYFLRVVYALLIFRSGGVMLHAAGILRDGQVYVFFGHSGAGKSTIARLSGPDQVLNDDLIALLPGRDGWIVYSTPFWNPTQFHPNPLRGPLAGIYRLIQDTRVFIESMSPGQGVAELLASIPVIPDIPSQRTELIRRCLEIQEQTPVKGLHFLPDTSFWSHVTAGLLDQ